MHPVVVAAVRDVDGGRDELGGRGVVERGELDRDERSPDLGDVAAAERVDAMAPVMNQVLAAARAKGVQIIHAPSDTMHFYEGSAARRRVQDAPPVAPPEPQEREVPPLPLDASDEGSDTGETKTHRAWSRQHAALEIDERVEREQVAALKKIKETRDKAAVEKALAGVRRVAKTKENLMPLVIEAAEVRCTVGEIMNALAEVFGRVDGTTRW